MMGRKISDLHQKINDKSQKTKKINEYSEREVRIFFNLSEIN